MASTISESSHAPRLYRVREAAQILAISEPGLRKWIQRGVVPAVKIEGALRIDRRDLERLIERSRFQHPPG